MAMAIPDPTIDLDWSGYVGSISSHFQRNAERHPEKICVVETAYAGAPERTFSYGQIFRASNILAHHLQQSGVTNGDVVMIWAHRSVDLVIAIMGTLSSGATMSILDPAYPPARQKIYLEVAQPRALINIARATDEAGQLAPIVRTYIETELHLKTEVPALRLMDDGTVLGGDQDEQDVFHPVAGLASSPPSVLVGPDSNPTLSFTSGSEGRPKGVLGRHFSLAYYFAWMAGRFALSAKSKFTLLSGIAHDPVQRDIFTPLFLGAQLLVPSKDDIQHEKLAEWMQRYGPTVTHLTPAMGQILVGGATAKFPALDRAFFVGDVLTTRDCRSLRDLAINANIVNMYGTTETQRAVSYYEIPSRAKDPTYLEQLKDIVPAGRGMKNVQLLVVSRQDRTRQCAIGEEGEIYVRAGGLAEGYIGDKAMNDQKFIPNWFVDNNKWIHEDKKRDQSQDWRKYFKGPRDRLYRTGDLGRYLASGDVECTGRADDQVKIRGFRIELNEIDSNLSQNSLVRDCKTMVRRDRNEEPSLVSYVVPELLEWRPWLAARSQMDMDDEGIQFGNVRVFKRRFGLLQTELREHLKGRLPSYAVPTVYIIMNKLPLNPNGKVDRPSLPAPDFAEQKLPTTEDDHDRWVCSSSMQQTVAKQWSQIIRGLNPKSIHGSDNFFDLGGHSILAQQMLLGIRRETGAKISINALYEHPSLEGFTKQVETHLQNPSDSSIQKKDQAADCTYSCSLPELLKRLPASFQSANPASIRASAGPVVFLTGATGFLGAYLISDILQRTTRALRLIAHVRNVKSSDAAMSRIRNSLKAYGLWQDAWSSRLSCVVGDLAQPRLGLDNESWDFLAQQVDVVIHNGATVHWVKRWQDLLASNVDSTIDAMLLCNEGKPKTFTFVSSTSVLDTDHYVRLSDAQIGTGQHAVSEDDDLEGSRKGLGTGYGQTKWMSEQLVRAAGKRGLVGSIVRPGYILGDYETGVCNTDDFLIRMLKGCIQLQSRPKIVNTINAVPVNHVARVVVAASLNPLHRVMSMSAAATTPSTALARTGVNVVHVTGHPRLRMSEYLSLLEYYGYQVPETSYTEWKDNLEKYVSAGGLEKDQDQSALMPLYHFCVNDLPANTKAPELDDSNAVAILKMDAAQWGLLDESAGYGITREDVGRSLRYLANIKFVDWPSNKGRPLPQANLDETQIQAITSKGGRGAAR